MLISASSPGAIGAPPAGTLASLDPGPGSSSADRDRHAADAHLGRWSGRTELRVTGDAPYGQALRHVEIGGSVVDPRVNSLRCPIGESKTNVDDDAIMAQRERNGDRPGLGLGSRGGSVLSEGRDENEDGEGRREAHRKIVAAWETLNHGGYRDTRRVLL
jgi:hypothetical protein